MRFYSNVDMRGNHIQNCPDLSNIIFTPGYSYTKGDLIAHKNIIYIVSQDFISSNAGPEIDDDFNADLTSGNLEVYSLVGSVVREYTQATEYKKDTLVYCGDRLGRIVADFTSDKSRLFIEESFKRDIDAGSIVVDDIAINELEAQLLKALPIVAFVSTSDVPRFQSNLKIDGSVPKFRDGSLLDDDEKKGASFFYIMDSNNELTGLALVLDYDEPLDEFTVNAMKYGVGTTDNILPTRNKLTKRDVGETEIIAKDDLLDPIVIIKTTYPDDKTKLWFESATLDASDLVIGTNIVKQYDAGTDTWVTTTVDLKDSEVVKNGNGADWQYYRLYTRGHVAISLADWQLIYDTNQILGKIINVDTVNHQVTIRIIHANHDADATLAEDVQANVAVGGAPANFLYKKGMTFTEFVQQIAVKDVLATCNFSISGSGLKKKGTTVNGSSLIATITSVGNIPIQDIKFYAGNNVLSSENFDSGTMTYTYTFSDPITNNVTFAVVITHTNGQTVEKQMSITFVNPAYFGSVSTLTPTDSDILALSENLKSNKSGQYTQTMNDSHTCYAYPASMGNLTHIKDDNNFEYIDSFTKTAVVVNGESYNVYVLTDPVTISNFVWKFD